MFTYKAVHGARGDRRLALDRQNSSAEFPRGPGPVPTPGPVLAGCCAVLSPSRLPAQIRELNPGVASERQLAAARSDECK